MEGCVEPQHSKVSSLARPFRFKRLVRARVAADVEPQFARGAVIPPLGLLAGDVRPVVEKLGPLPLGHGTLRPLT